MVNPVGRIFEKVGKGLGKTRKTVTDFIRKDRRPEMDRDLGVKIQNKIDNTVHRPNKKVIELASKEQESAEKAFVDVFGQVATDEARFIMGDVNGVGVRAKGFNYRPKLDEDGNFEGWVLSSVSAVASKADPKAIRHPVRLPTEIKQVFDGNLKGGSVSWRVYTDPKTGAQHWELGSVSASYAPPVERPYGSVIGGATWGLRKLNTIIDFVRKYVQEFLLIAGFIMFKDFVLEETVQTSQFGNFISTDNAKALNHALKNNLIALEIAMSNRDHMFWNYNQAAFDGFFNTAINTYKSYLLRNAIMLQPEIPFLLSAKYNGEDVEASILWLDEFKYQFTPEEVIQKIVPNENGKFKIKFRAQGYKDVDRVIEVKSVAGMNVQDEVIDRIEEKFLFRFNEYSSINEEFGYKKILLPTNMTTRVINRVYNNVFNKDYDMKGKHHWKDYLVDGDLHPYLIKKLQQQVYETKDYQIRKEFEYTYYDDTAGTNVIECTTLGYVNKFFEKLKPQGLAIDKERLYLFTLDLIKQENLTHDYIQSNFDNRIAKSVVFTKAQTDELILIINGRGTKRRLVDETNLYYTNWGTYLGARKYPFLYHSIKETIIKNPLDVNTSKMSIKNEWMFSFGLHTYFIREHLEDPGYLYLYRSRDLVDIIHPDEVMNITKGKIDLFEWRDITGKTVEWLEDPVNKDSLWSGPVSKVVLSVELQKFTDDPMFKMSDVDGVDREKFINFLLEQVGVGWVDDKAKITYILTDVKKEVVEVTKGDKKITVEYNKYTREIKISGYFSEEVPDGVFTGQVTEKADGSIYIWSPGMTVNQPKREVDLIIDGDDGNLYVDSYFIGAFKNKEVFKYRLANGSHWVRIQTEFYDESIPWSFNDETPFLPGTTKHTFKHSIPIQYQSKVASSYLDYRSYLTIDVFPKNARIEFISKKTGEVFNYISGKPIDLTEGSYRLKISAKGYKTYAKDKYYKGGMIDSDDQLISGDDYNKLSIILNKR
jgi:hypothetical protein